MVSKIFCVTIQVMLLSIVAVHGVPANYCFYPLNKTNCGGAPTPVFSYYKSGSRCEIEIWRGCPSYNRFDSMTSCTHYCIARMNEIEEEPCEGKLNDGNCGTTPITVYTYNYKTQTCEKAQWRGCRTTNMFESKTKCLKDCVPQKEPWEESVKKLSDKDVNEMNQLVDEILKEEPTHDKLKNVHVPEPTTVATAEATTAEVTTAEVTTAEATTETITEEIETTTVPHDHVDEVESVL